MAVRTTRPRRSRQPIGHWPRCWGRVPPVYLCSRCWLPVFPAPSSESWPGQVIMQGFVSFRIPLWLRRLVVMMPSFAVIIAGMDITHALVLSQVVLSLILPIPMVALVRLTANRDVMGEFANSRLTNAVAVTATVFVSALNAVLLLGIVGLGIPLSGG